MDLLISEIEELQDYLNVYDSFRLEELTPFIRLCENKYIKKAIGKELYTELLAAYVASKASTSPTPLSSVQTELWGYCVSALAHLAFYEGSSSFNVAITSGGATRIETQNAKSAFQYQINDYKRDRKDHGFRALDDLLTYLEANEDSFATYKASATRTAFKKMFVSTALVFDQYRSINEDRWLFLQLRNQMEFISNTRIKSVIGETRFDAIKVELLTTPSAENLELLNNYIRPAIAHLSFAEAIIDLAVNVDDRGITIYNTENTRGDIVMYKEAPSNYLFALRKSELEKGNYYISALETKIKALDTIDADESFVAGNHTSETDNGFAALT